MKKVFTLILALAMMLSLAACGSSSSGAGSDTGSNAGDGSGSGGNAASISTEVTYPTGDVNFIIPSGAGGGNDLCTRALIGSLQDTLGANVVPMNQSESGGAVAANTIMTANPDGQYLYFNSQTLIISALTNVKSIDLKQFQPVAQVVEDTGVIFVRPNTYKTAADIAAAAKGGSVKIATNGDGALWGVAAKQLAETLGVDLQNVVYASGGSAMLTALAAGEVDVCIVNYAEASSMVDAGKVVPIAVMSDERLSVLPDVPTLHDAGYDLTFAVWRGVFTKAGVSEEILNKLDAAFEKATQSEEFVEFCKNSALPIKFRNHTEFTKFFNEEISRYSTLLG